MSDLYAIVDNGVVVEYGLNKVMVTNRIGIKNKVKKYILTDAIGELTNYTYKEEITPKFDIDGELYQQWKTHYLDIPIIKENLKNKYSVITTNYIETSYNELKQRSDLVDKEFYSISLLTNPLYSTNFIQQECIKYANIIVKGDNTLDDILNSYTEDEAIKWGQLIKAYIRVIWVIDCKTIFRAKINELNNAATIDDIKNVDTKLVFPDFPLPVSNMQKTSVDLLASFLNNYT